SPPSCVLTFSFTPTSPPMPYTLSLHDALPISSRASRPERTLPARRCDTSARRASALAVPSSDIREGTTTVQRAHSPFEPKYHTRSEEHTSELQSRGQLVCRLPLENKQKTEYCI